MKTKSKVKCVYFIYIMLLVVGASITLLTKQNYTSELLSKSDTKEIRKQISNGKSISEKNVYLTFDDGPCGSTPELLDALDRSGVKATFFVTAQFLDKAELISLIKEIDARGHRVAVHSYSHDYKNIYSSVKAYMDDFDKMDDIIFEATGKRSKVYRFPGGSNTGYNTNIRKELIQRMNERGLVYYDWNAYDGDNDGYQGKELIDRAVLESSYTNKSILLMHNIPNKDSVIEGIEEIVRKLKEQGYSFDVLDENVKPIQFV